MSNDGHTNYPTVQAFLDNMTDPDDVGSSEYRAVHELLHDCAMTTHDTEADIELLEGILTELRDTAEAQLVALEAYKKTGKLPNER